jgi:twinkle protein
MQEINKEARTMKWVKDENVVEFRKRVPKCEDALYMAPAGRHITAGGKILTEPVRGDRMPWSKTHSTFRFRPGEFSVWAGQNFTGKSLMLGQIALGFLSQQRKVAIVSLEMPPARTLARMLRQASGTREPTAEFEREFEKWLGENLYIYERLVSLTPKRTIEIIDYCATELGVHHVIIDSLMKCNSGAGSYEAQKLFVDALFRAAKVTDDLHLHVVAHFGKPKPGQKMDRYCIKGPTEIPDIADNVLILSRNQKKKKEMEKPEEERSEKIMEQSDGMLIVDKQRNGEWDGSISLWYHRDSMQFVAKPDGRAIDFIALSEAESEREAIQGEQE